VSISPKPILRSLDYGKSSRSGAFSGNMSLGSSPQIYQCVSGAAFALLRLIIGKFMLDMFLLILRLMKTHSIRFRR